MCAGFNCGGRFFMKMLALEFVTPLRVRLSSEFEATNASSRRVWTGPASVAPVDLAATSSSSQGGPSLVSLSTSASTQQRCKRSEGIVVAHSLRDFEKTGGPLAGPL